MRRTIKIDFADFWVGFIKGDNFFEKLHSRHYHVEISNDPDIIFYSCYGRNYLNYNCVRIFYSAENIRPDFTGCDYALTFDLNNDDRHYRLPLYGIYYQGYVNDFSLDPLLNPLSRNEAEKRWENKKKFCCMVVSNGKAKKRIDFFKKLSKFKQVDSGGRYLNNIGTGIGDTVMDKLNFIGQYKFVIAFENSSYPGYTTEKILEPFFADCIPIYWGNPLIEKDFNKKRFINFNDFANEDDLIQFMLEVDKNNSLAVDILTEPVFPENKLPICNHKENVLDFLNSIIEKIGETKPVAKTQKKVLHFFSRKINLVKNYSNILLRKNFR